MTGPHRPLPLTLLCLVGWALVGVVAVRLGTRWRAFQDAGPGLVATGLLVLGVTVFALVGYWRMKRWGLWLILAGVALRLVVSGAGVTPLRAVDLVWPGVLAFAGLVYVRRLT